MSVKSLVKEAKAAASEIATAATRDKNETIFASTRLLRDSCDSILVANEKDVEQAKSKGIAQPLIDRLVLNEDGIERMCTAAEAVAALPDPIGVLEDIRSQPSGIRVGTMRIPLGVIGMIYESRPNVTLEAASLAIKSGNAIVLRGGSEAINTNTAIADCVEKGLEEVGLPKAVVGLIRVTDRSAVGEMLKLPKYIDLIVPRGGKSLIERVSEESSIPVLKHLDGICHVYIDEYAEEDMAIEIAVNSKAEKLAVCNAAETLLVAEGISKRVLPQIIQQFQEKNIEVRGCERSRTIVPDITMATEEDWRTEYLDSIISVRVVSGLEAAINHIQTFGSGHTDTIVTNKVVNAERFTRAVDSASVMVNTSTQFADGFEYGLGAEIGISTDKLHARGPVGLEGLTTRKFVVFSDGQVRHR